MNSINKTNESNLLEDLYGIADDIESTAGKEYPHLPSVVEFIGHIGTLCSLSDDPDLQQHEGRFSDLTKDLKSSSATGQTNFTLANKIRAALNPLKHTVSPKTLAITFDELPPVKTPKKTQKKEHLPSHVGPRASLTPNHQQRTNTNKVSSKEGSSSFSNSRTSFPPVKGASSLPEKNPSLPGHLQIISKQIETYSQEKFKSLSDYFGDLSSACRKSPELRQYENPLINFRYASSLLSEMSETPTDKIQELAQGLRNTAIDMKRKVSPEILSSFSGSTDSSDPTKYEKLASSPPNLVIPNADDRSIDSSFTDDSNWPGQTPTDSRESTIDFFLTDDKKNGASSNNTSYANDSFASLGTLFPHLNKTPLQGKTPSKKTINVALPTVASANPPPLNVPQGKLISSLKPLPPIRKNP